jgi:hypothetical protein
VDVARCSARLKKVKILGFSGHFEAEEIQGGASDLNREISISCSI